MDIIICPIAPVLLMQTVLSKSVITDITLLQTAVVQPGEIAGYSWQVQDPPSMADIITSETLQDVYKRRRECRR